MSEFTARWVAGAETLTISCLHGRVWHYKADVAGKKPPADLLWGTPWLTAPGSDWDEDAGVRSVAVVPESRNAAAELFALDEGASLLET